MLTPEQWSDVGNQAKKIYSEFELEIIEEIASRITATGLINSVAYSDILIAQEMGMLHQDIISLVSKHSSISENKILELFENAGIKSLNFDDSIYKLAGLKPIPIQQSESMLQLLKAGAVKTNGNLSNLVMTTADTSQTAFFNSINKAYLEVSTGLKSYSTAILDAIEEVSKNGAIVEYPSGYRTSIENACRMNVITGVNQTCGKLQELRAEEMDWDLMEITAHPGARPEHTIWQGQIVSRSGRAGYLSYDDIGYGTAGGFKGINCRHDWYPFYEGSTRTFNNAELQELKQQTVNYNGKDISLYDATQIQRKMERQIRNDRKQIAGLQGALKSNNSNLNLKELEEKLKIAKISLKHDSEELNNFIRQINRKMTKDTKGVIIKEQIKIGSLEKTLGKEHTQKIVEAIKNVPEDIKKVWNNFIDKININDINYKGPAHYSWNDNGIYINLNKISKDRIDEFVGKTEKEIYKKAYGTLYHETGHHISAIYSNNKGQNKDVSEWFESKKYFKEQFAKDGSKIKIGMTLDEMVKKEGWEYIDNTLKELRVVAKQNGLKANSINAIQVYQKITKDLREMSVLEQMDISDMFDGVTNGKIYGYGQHSVTTKNYWKINSVGSEAFAEMIDATINNSASLKRIKEYFPKSYEIFEEIIKEMGNL